MKTAPAIHRNPLCWCVAVLCAAALVFAGTRPLLNAPQLLSVSGPTMGTRYTVKVVSPPARVDPKQLQEDIGGTLAEVDSLMSTYREDSEVCRLNRFGRTDWFGVSRHTAAVIDEARRVGELTGGAFDVTVGPLVDLWGFGPEEAGGEAPPSTDAISRADGRVGFDNVEVRLSPPAVRKRRADLHVDLSGIAKGFAVDQIAARLDACGIRNYLVEVGGELRAKGHNRHGRPWQIAVESPRAGSREIQKVVALKNLAMATSGDYRNYYEHNAARYCHIIDPRTGRPISHRLASVTVLCPSCARADALATALMVLGPEAGYKLAIRQRLAALLVIKGDAGFVEKATPRFTQVLK